MEKLIECPYCKEAAVYLGKIGKPRCLACMHYVKPSWVNSKTERPEQAPFLPPAPEPKQLRFLVGDTWI